MSAREDAEAPRVVVLAPPAERAAAVGAAAALPAAVWAGVALACAVYAVGLATEQVWVRLATKPWIILALIAWVRAASAEAPADAPTDAAAARYARWVVRGLALSLVGDLLLEEREALFLPGVLAFLAGHVAYVAGYLSVTRRPALLVGLPFALWGAGLYLHLLPGLGPATVPIGVYALALSVMMWRAAALVPAATSAGADPRAARAAWLAAGGALLFGVSDSLIALDRFGGLGLPHVRFPIIGLYWLGQVGIAASAVARAGAGRRA